eukprot:8656068-Ditylum_brightwellii.AAC.1
MCCNGNIPPVATFDATWRVAINATAPTKADAAKAILNSQLNNTMIPGLTLQSAGVCLTPAVIVP